MRRLALAVVASTLALVPAAAEGASEAFPGRNGLIVFASDRTSPREPEIYAASVDGGAPRNLTRDEGWDSRCPHPTVGESRSTPRVAEAVVAAST